jgi:hypothetical protein
VTPGEVRMQIIVDDTTRVILPAKSEATPIIGAVLKAPFSISQSTVVSGELRMEINDNQPRTRKDNERGEITTFFDSPFRLSAALLLQSRW